ncbi:hypothetical protein AN214_00059 [Pseudoalteromonas sp. P1-9]|uniref:hypothetical protein n=1 Tax=Pseudoalteromonas TaxID=53246 RepID=UPI0006D6061B|nr:MULTISPECIES: hypothetical protein [Pseudoalteromonas]KPV98298.1 hypothetical protein AN214_00059 [Pseudoalteromonas sp. P1-9]
MHKVSLSFNQHQCQELTPMQTKIMYQLVINTITQQYGEDRVNQIIDAFNGDYFSILKCGISLLASDKYNAK